MTGRIGIVSLCTIGVLAPLDVGGFAGSALSHHALPAPCVRSAKRTFKPGEVVELAMVPRECRLTAISTGTVLQLPDDDRISEINRVFRAPSGDFFTTSRSAEFAAWDAKGRFLGAIGDEGRGPGEFAKGAKTIHFDSTGRMYVRDNNMRWSTFDAGRRFIETMSAAGMGFDQKTSAFMDLTTFVTADPLGSKPNEYFHLYDFSRERVATARSVSPSDIPGGPRLVRSFGAVPNTEPQRHELGGRLIAVQSKNTFWAAPPPGSSRGYEIELWSTDGQRLLTLRRTVAWLPRRAYDARPSGDGAPQAIPPAQAVTLRCDGRGLLYVAFFVPNNRWQSLTNVRPDERGAVMDRMADIYVDVIDTDAGVILSSSGPLPRSRVLAEHGDGFFPGTPFAYRMTSSNDGLDRVVILEHTLSAR